MDQESKLNRSNQQVEDMLTEHGLTGEAYPTASVIAAVYEAILTSTDPLDTPEYQNSVLFAFGSHQYRLDIARKTGEEVGGPYVKNQYTDLELRIFDTSSDTVLEVLSVERNPDAEPRILLETNEVSRFSLLLEYETRGPGVGDKGVKVDTTLLTHPQVEENGWGMGLVLSQELVIPTLVADFIKKRYNLQNVLVFIRDIATDRHDFASENRVSTAWSSRVAKLLGFTKDETYAALDHEMGSVWWKYHFLGD